MNTPEFSSSQNSPVVAVIEDDDDLRANLLLYLRREFRTAWGVPSAEAFYRQLAVEPAEIVVVDLGLPGEDGLSVVRHLRQDSSRGIVILTARGGVDERIAGFQAGADHYFIKPVDIRELGAAIAALWRRVGLSAVFQVPAREAGAWKLHLDTARLESPNGHGLELTFREFALIRRLAEQAHELVGKYDLHDAVFPNHPTPDFHRVEVILSRLRQKVDRELELPLPVRSVFGRGLIFSVPCEVA